MKQRFFWRFVFFVVLPLFLSAVFMWPPTPRDLIEVFRDEARRRDETFTQIVQRAQEMEQGQPERAFTALQDAIGTNDIRPYFPEFNVKSEANPTFAILARLQRQAAGKIKLGLDLQGGTSFLLEMDTNRLASIETVTNAQGQLVTVTNRADLSEMESALDQAVEVLRKRVDAFGVAEPVIRPAGFNRIEVQLPGLSAGAREQAKTTIQRAAYLEFKLVHPDSAELIATGEIPPGYEVLSRTQAGADGQKQLQQLVVRKRADMVGGIKQATPIRNNFGQPEVQFALDSQGTETFAEITRNNVGRLLAIVLDGELQSAPIIKSPIVTGSGVIEGGAQGFSPAEAVTLANVLENPLKAPLKPVFSTDVDPTLGKDSIRSGIKAAVIGVILVAAFMLVYYLLAGFVANAALCLNIIFLMGILCAIGATLTLPGIAGIVLTIGMAVDANVLIFERIREELNTGKSLRGAVAAGYAKAFSTIFDSNVTTLISSVILIFMGTGPVKGFGVTLTIGVCVSMFTALVVTRLLFDWMLAKNLIKNLKMFHVIGQTKVDFMRWAVPAFVASWLLILIGNGYGIFVRGNDVLGVEFTGGDSITLSLDQSQDISVDRIRDSAQRAAAGDVLVGYQRDVGTGERTLRVTVRSAAAADAPEQNVSETVIARLKADFPEANFSTLLVDQIGPSVGKEIQRTAIVAALLAMFGILVYVAFRYEFSFAVGAVVAVIHDILMVAGWYFLAGHQMNATTVAAFLTIIGFSINDTIVIFDRIREDLKLGVRGSFRDVINHAINQTLSRTIITSGTVLLATLSLYIFGGGVIHDFAFAFLVGIVVGTYSTIYIAAFIVLRWHKGQRPSLAAGPLTVPNAPVTAPSRA